VKITSEQIRDIVKEELEAVIDEQYYNSLKPVENYKDGDDLIGQRLWSHTNRTHRGRGMNGMIGLYGVNSKGNRKGSPLYYTNCIRLGNPIVFQVSETGAEKIAQTGHRTLAAGVSGKVIKTNEEQDLEGFVPFGFNPFGENKFFHVDGKKLIGAEEVYFYASEDGKYKSLVKKPKFEGQEEEPENMEKEPKLPFSPDDLEKFDKPSISGKRKYNRRKKVKDPMTQVPLDFGE